MKRYLTLLVAAIALCGTTAAQMRTAYFMEGSYFRTDMNPALAPTRGYIALPALGGVGLNLNNNFLSVDNMFYKRGGEVVTFLNEQVTTDEFMKKMPKIGALGLNADVNLLGFGAHTKRMFWNVSMRMRSQTDVSLNSDIFSTLKSLGNGRHEFAGTSINSLNFMELGVGVAIPIKQIATVGVRVKGLLGLAHLQADLGSMYADVNSRAVTGSVRGNLRAAGVLFNSGYAPGSTDITDAMINFEGQSVGEVMKTALGQMKSGGVAIDLGAEVRLLDDHLRISAALTDLGFISWGKGTIVKGEANADFLFEGINFESGEEAADGSAELLLTDPGTKGYTTRLNCTLNVGVEYNILNNHIAFGLLSHTEFRPSTTLTELTASVNFRIGRWFTTTLSHTFLNRNRPGIFGFALNVHPTGVNFFLGADFIGTQFAKYDTIPLPMYMKSVNVYAGLGFNLGKAKYMKCMQTPSKREKKSKK